MADHFPLNELPPELRIRVWEACLPHRTIFYDSPSIGISLIILHDGPNVGNPTILGPPAIAQVCQESRAVAFEHGNTSNHCIRWLVINTRTHLVRRFEGHDCFDE